MAGEEVADPGEALVETTQERGQGEPYARRVTTAGEVLDRSSTNVYYDGAEWHFDPQPLAWRRVTALEPDELERVREAIGSSGFMGAAPSTARRERRSAAPTSPGRPRSTAAPTPSGCSASPTSPRPRSTRCRRPSRA